MFTSHHYNLDPSDPNFKRTEAMETILQEKQKRRKDEPNAETVKVNFKHYFFSRNFKILTTHRLLIVGTARGKDIQSGSRVDSTGALDQG